MNPMRYNLTLCEPDGTLVASIPEMPALPRFLYVTPATLQLADHLDENLDRIAAETTTIYAGVASSVWTDDDRNALYVQIVSHASYTLRFVELAGVSRNDPRPTRRLPRRLRPRRHGRRRRRRGHPTSRRR